MVPLPKSIEPCSIIEAIFEIRFESTVPGDAIFGIIYNEFKNEYQNSQQLSILQLPAAIRSQDPNLKFSPHYRIEKENFVIQIGPNVFSLANIKSYCGWEEFSKEIQKTYQKLQSLGIIKEHLRTALRYINIFPEINIFQKSNLLVSLNKEILGESSANLTVQMPYEYGKSDLKLVNSAEISLEGGKIKGSLIDIDTSVDINMFDSFEKAIETAHYTEKTLFYKLLKEDFLSTLNPVYEEE